MAGTGSILVVEDEMIVARDIQFILRGMGFEVPNPVRYAEDAVAGVKEGEPDLVLMDIHLRGEMTGIQAAEAISKFSDVPVVYLTANGDDMTLQKAALTNHYGYIIKPYNERILKATVERALTGYRHGKRIGDTIIGVLKQRRIGPIGP